MFIEVTSQRFHFASPSSSCIHTCSQAPGEREVSFPLEENMGNKVLPLFHFSCRFVERMRCWCSL